MREGPPSAAEVDAIAALAEPVFRNLNITLAYARLSQAFAAWCPGGANWCTFATWASRQAGCTIRKEDLARAVSRRLQARLEHRPIRRALAQVLAISNQRLARIVAEVSEGLPGIDRASDAVARGNRKVFEEIGREFARLIGDGGPDDSTVAAFLEGLRHGPPPDGQDLLRHAFTNYVAARATTDPGLRAQLILLGNVQIGLHEQTRLQPEIREAMDATLLDVADLRRRIVERLDQVIESGPLGAVHTGLGGRLINRFADEISEELRLVARVVVTDALMTIGLPGDEALRLGSDLRREFPAALRTLTHPEIVMLLRDFDRTPDSTSGSGAIDWSVLPQRLHFIADFFRSCQEEPALFGPPFDAEQLMVISAGGVPDRV
jgi:hypothetical protein